MLEAGRVVLATCGRDKGSYYVITGERDGRMLIADGKRRQLQCPKAKNPHHLTPTEHELCMTAVTGNRRLRRMLSELGRG